MNIDKYIKSVTFPLTLFRLPVWLFDVATLQVVWANAAALAQCDATELEELQNRNMAFDLSCKVRERLRLDDSNVNALNDAMSEYLTLYPGGKAVTYECSISALEPPAGGRWLLVNGLRRVTASGSDALYRNHALLHTLVCVSIYGLDGRLKYSNPAARAMLGSKALALGERFQDKEEWQDVLARLTAGYEVRTEAKVATAAGPSWHSLTLEICPDPVTAESTVLVTELDVSARRQSQEQIQQLAYHDVLTGLPNRASWDEMLKATLESREQPFSVMFMDLDGFKAVNDTYGHNVGDKLLIAVSMRISDCLYDGEFLARLGGDEFTLLMNDDEVGSHSLKRAKRIVRSLAVPVVIEGHTLTIALSIGISRFRSGLSGGASEIMQQADIAMYEAKKAGGGIVQFEPDTAEESRHHIALEYIPDDTVEAGEQSSDGKAGSSKQSAVAA